MDGIGNRGGLSGSRWAPHNSNSSSREASRTRGLGTDGFKFNHGRSRELDWDCHSCGFSNFGWRKECFRCDRPKGWNPVDEAVVGLRNDENSHPVTNGGGNGVGKVLDSFPHVDGSGGGTHGRSAGAGGVSVEGDQQIGVISRGALSMSIWAPRNRTNSQKYGDKTWTRVTQNHAPSSQPCSRPTSPPDLGLPYEVQHFILATMQRILEEACFDLASRWIPAQLKERNWSCSEAVELSAWKKFLPTAIPYNAIRPVLSYSLEMGLTDAVRVRNSAVHRHLCNNREIRTLAFKASNLMEMFGDMSRKEKFDRLVSELSRWDGDSRVDRDAARAVLEDALRAIGERPMDDMDWTPNAVSLQEIKNDKAGGMRQAEQDDYHYGDEMELD